MSDVVLNEARSLLRLLDGTAWKPTALIVTSLKDGEDQSIDQRAIVETEG